ncbi:hypothetical protein EDD18DRAFT_1335267 [Armillaria luteobubalina]|uniref:Uncharacterized protein n=1 Tax=Armillaria luteobubalina TaxID=153913 RepID=A0AA39PR05_9AGAR|nr:hypothetical protein EDD18DRAFT_1338614 [Armillaria luteobubalina]KAK0488226.1 hypothetical protein EDD18DRAFT_1335267 [Armillaria luteobubalina]
MAVKAAFESHIQVVTYGVHLSERQREPLTPIRLRKHLDRGTQKKALNLIGRKLTNGERSIGGTFKNKKFLAPTLLRWIILSGHVTHRERGKGNRRTSVDKGEIGVKSVSENLAKELVDLVRQEKCYPRRGIVDPILAPGGRPPGYGGFPSGLPIAGRVPVVVKPVCVYESPLERPPYCQEKKVDFGKHTENIDSSNAHPKSRRNWKHIL